MDDFDSNGRYTKHGLYKRYIDDKEHTPKCALQPTLNQEFRVQILIVLLAWIQAVLGVSNGMDAIVALFLREDGTKSNLTGICLENKSAIGSKTRISKDAGSC